MTNKDLEEMEKKIQSWLLEEGFKIKMQPDPKAYFNFLLEDKQGRKVNIAQLTNKKDQIQIGTEAILSEELRERVMGMKTEDRDRLLWILRLGLLNRIVGFSGVSTPLQSVRIIASVYYDGLTKDNFIRSLFEVRKALLFVFWMVERELENPSRQSHLRMHGCTTYGDVYSIPLSFFSAFSSLSNILPTRPQA